ncbi:MAG: hypothetical protein ABIJ21_00135 [Nanoarchaeota archaeon]
MIPFLTYLLLILILIILGNVGLYIAAKAKEELRPGKRVFIIAGHITLALLFILIAIFYSLNAISLVILVTIYLTTILINKEHYSYMILGMLLSLGLHDAFLQLILAALIAIYLLFSSALIYLYAIEKKLSKKALFLLSMQLYLLFLGISLLGYLFKSQIIYS